MKKASLTYWVVASDGGHARIFSMTREPATFVEVQELVSDSQHQTNRELTSDASGRIANVKGGPSSHSMEPRSNAHDLAEVAFSNRLVRKLEQAADKSLFESLVILADPRTLGHLRKQMNKRLAARIEKEVNRDLVGMPPDSLEKRVRAELGWSD